MAALLSAAVTAQTTKPAQIIYKIRLATDPAQLWAAISAVPTGVSGVLVYPLDRSLIVRGTADVIEELKAALRVVDVPTEGDRYTVRLWQGNPDAVRTAALALPQAGTVGVQDKNLTFTGKEEWLRAVKGVVFGAELTHPGPRPDGLSALGPGSTRPAPVPAQVTVKVFLAHTQPNRLWAGRQAVPAGISGVLVEPFDKSLIVQGTPAAVEEAKAALRIIDVSMANGRMPIRLGVAEPEAVRKAAAALPQAGTIQSEGRTLTFVGNALWLNAVKGAVFAAELVHPGLRPPEMRGLEPRVTPIGRMGTVTVPGYGEVDVFGPVMAPPPSIPATVEVVLPEGDRLRIVADSILLGGQDEGIRLEGNVTLTLPGGVQIRSRNAGVMLSPADPKGGRRLTIQLPSGN